MENPIAKKVKCNKCGYTWNTLSQMVMVSCPSCLTKVQIKKIEAQK